MSTLEQYGKTEKRSKDRTEKTSRRPYSSARDLLRARANLQLDGRGKRSLMKSLRSGGRLPRP